MFLSSFSPRVSPTAAPISTNMNGKAPTLIALLSGYSMQEIRSDILLMCKEEPNLRIAIGTTVDEPTEIRSSYDKAKLTLAMIPALRQQVMAYSDLGIYKMLYEIKDKELADEFIDEILGKLIRYDKKNHSDYMTVLESFMKNECMVSQTAEAMFFHRNTIKYKLAAIHEILGYDVTLNENRFKIMMAFYLIKIRKN